MSLLPVGTGVVAAGRGVTTALVGEVRGSGLPVELVELSGVGAQLVADPLLPDLRLHLGSK